MATSPSLPHINFSKAHKMAGDKWRNQSNFYSSKLTKSIKCINRRERVLLLSAGNSASSSLFALSKFQLMLIYLLYWVACCSREAEALMHSSSNRSIRNAPDVPQNIRKQVQSILHFVADLIFVLERHRNNCTNLVNTRFRQYQVLRSVWVWP